jgi:hypothetical protein
MRNKTWYRTAWREEAAWDQTRGRSPPLPTYLCPFNFFHIHQITTPPYF